jgi:hypothetical protein
MPLWLLGQMLVDGRGLLMPNEIRGSKGAVGAASDQFSEEETARRAQAVIKRMLDTPPKPHKATPRTVKLKERPAQKGRVHRAKSRS